MVLEAGSKAPPFRLADQAGKSLALSDLVGRQVVLYFYPKDLTSGCTQEARDFRDHHAAITASGAVVLGVSPDPPARHATFVAKEQLPFTLLADPEHVAAEAYGVWVEKTLYGRKYMGVARTTFLIDESGRIARAWHGVKVAGHVDEVLAALSGVKPSPPTKRRLRRTSSDSPRP